MSRHFLPISRISLLACLAGLFACTEDSPVASAPNETTPELAAAAALSFASVSAGWDHSCAISAAAKAYCWGNNQDGQLGTANKIRQFTPTAVAGGISFDGVSAGNFNSCAVSTGELAYCWGRNFPNGRTTEPTLVDGSIHLVQVSAELNHVCGVQADGAAYCRGENSDGQLGDGSRIDRSSLVPVSGAHSFRQISTSTYHTCAVTTDDRAYCWGDNSFGELGDGNTGDGSTAIRRLRPVAVVGGLHFRQISAGNGFTCGVTTDDRAYCWGRNTSGQLGDETTTDHPTPAAVHGGKLFRQVAAGHNHVCGATTDNRGFCWGRGAEGQRGDGKFDTIDHGMKPALVAGGLAWQQIAAGGLHSCGVTTGNVAYCWGYNGKGQLGDGTQASRSRPTRVG
jgi:alpha-tubulin suppressor-like RCC1 family protein